MAQRTKKRKKRSSRKMSTLEIQNPNAAGIDIGSREHWVAVRPDQNEQPTRCFPNFTKDLNELADWLIDCDGINRRLLDSVVSNIRRTWF